MRPDLNDRVFNCVWGAVFALGFCIWACGVVLVCYGFWKLVVLGEVP